MAPVLCKLLLCTVFVQWLVVCEADSEELRNIAITGSQIDELSLGQNPELVEFAARTGELVRVDLTESRTLAAAEQGVSVFISCLPWLQASPEGSVARWSVIHYNPDFTEPLSPSPVILHPLEDVRRSIGGEFNELVAISWTMAFPGAEAADTGVYFCEACPSLDAPSEQCNVANLTLQVLGAPPVIDKGLDDAGPESQTDDRLVYKVGTDFCIPQNYRGEITILCYRDSDLTITFPYPYRAWSADGDLLYNRSATNLRDNLEFFTSDRMYLYPDVFIPSALQASYGGAILFDFSLINITLPDGPPLEEAREAVYRAVVGDWTCEIDNVFGSDRATSTITLCGPSAPQDVRVLSARGVIVWGPPAEPNGVITSYEVTFSGESSSRTVVVEPSELYNFYVITSEDTDGLGGDITVGVRARTGRMVGPGTYSELIDIETPTPVMCPPPITCPTCPPPSDLPTNSDLYNLPTT